MQYSTYHIHVCQLFCHNMVLKREEFFWIADLQFLSINQVTGGSATKPIWPEWKTPLSRFIQQTVNQSRCLFILQHHCITAECPKGPAWCNGPTVLFELEKWPED